jgi:lipoyl(octanoyl) transferase
VRPEGVPEGVLPVTDPQLLSKGPQPGVIWWLPLGRREYGETWALQKTLVALRRRRALPDLVITVEHPHVITTGRATDLENLLSRNAPDGSGQVPVVEVERGGDITYHGPGQCVAYFIFDLESRGHDLHRFLRDLEEVQLRILSEAGLTGIRVPGKTGVWVGDRKLGSIGIAVRQWVSYHGFALNVSTDLRFFSLINPCGFQADTMTSLKDLSGREWSLGELLPLLRNAVADVFSRRVVRVGEKRIRALGV